MFHLPIIEEHGPCSTAGRKRPSLSPCVATSAGPEPERPGPVVLGRLAHWIGQLMDTWDRSTDIINSYRISMVTIPFMNIYDPSQLVDDILMIEQLPLKPPLML